MQTFTDQQSALRAITDHFADETNESVHLFHDLHANTYHLATTKEEVVRLTEEMDEHDPGKYTWTSYERENGITVSARPPVIHAVPYVVENEKPFPDRVSAYTAVGMIFSRELIDRVYVVHDTQDETFYVARSEQEVKDIVQEEYEKGLDDSELVAGRFTGTVFEWTKTAPLSEHAFTIDAILEPRFEVTYE